MGDFNGDGYQDMAVGAALEDLGSGNSIKDAGAVNVIYGSAAGLTATGNQLWTQDSAGILDQAEAADLFGGALTVGDFNGDGVSDLAVAAPLENIGAAADSGAVNIIYGQAGTGLTSTNNQLWTEVQAFGSATAGDVFGDSLTAGDFNGDGVSDLVIGVPGRDVGAANAGGVDVVYGTSGVGLTQAGQQFWSQGQGGILGAPQTNDAMGALGTAAADLNGDGTDDLAVGNPFDDEAGPVDSGSVNVIFGQGGTGLVSTNNQIWTQNSPNIIGIASANAFFGFDVAAADLGNGPQADLAIGAPGKGIGTHTTAGVVNVIYGSASGPTSTGNQFWTQNTAGILGDAGTNDGFGNALAAADFNGDGTADLAIAVAGDLVGTKTSAGSVNVIYGTAGGLNASGNQLWTQNSPGIVGLSETGDDFGFDLAAGDLGNGSQADLVVGVALEDLGTGNSIKDAGAVNAIYGSSGGLHSTGNQQWTQDSPSIVGIAEAGDEFGFAFGFASSSPGNRPA